MQKPLAGLTGKDLVRESTAGVTLLAIAVPLNIGYAQIAGLPPTAGLYALILPAVIYALTVSSRQVVASPDAAAAALVASSVGGLAAAGSDDYLSLALAQAILCGVMFMLLAVFKLGFLANFLSKPILVGFVGGLALDILISQVAKMLGVKIDSGGEFVDKVRDLVTDIGTVNGWSVLISVVAIAVLLGGRRLAPPDPLGAGRAHRRHDLRRGGRPQGRRGGRARQGRSRAAVADLAGCRVVDVAHARAVGDRPDDGDDRGGTSRLAQLRREARLLDRPQPRPLRLRSRQRRRRHLGRLRGGFLHVAHRSHGPGRVAHAAAVPHHSRRDPPPARLRDRAPRGHPVAGDRRRRRDRDPASPRHRRLQATLADRPVRVHDRRRLLPRHPLHRRHPRDRGRLHARAHQPRSTCSQSGDRRAGQQRQPHRLAPPPGSCRAAPPRRA